MDVSVCKEDEELIEQLDSPILAINDFIVKGRPREYQKKMYALDFLGMNFFWAERASAFIASLSYHVLEFIHNFRRKQGVKDLCGDHQLMWRGMS